MAVGLCCVGFVGRVAVEFKVSAIGVVVTAITHPPLPATRRRAAV